MQGIKTAWNKDVRRHWFVVLVAYYVVATYLTPSTANIERLSLTYFALIIPAWLYVLANWRQLLVGYSTASRAMALFAILAGVFGLLRWDLSLTYNAAFLSAVAIIVLNSRAYLTVLELNWLFLSTVIGSVVVYGLGLTEYGFLPGQAEALGCHAAMNWRISLFRVPAESAMFSFVILIANILYGEQVPWWRRGLVVLLATYFLVFSGVRSIVLPALLVTCICVLAIRPRLTPKARRRFYAWAAFISMLVLLVPYFLGAGGEFWKNYFLRTQTCDYQLRYSIAEAPKAEAPKAEVPKLELDWYLWTFNRHCAAMYQFSLFADSPLGNRSVQPSSDQQLTDIGCPSNQLHYYCASCNFPTYWLARAGIPAIALLLCFLTLLAGAIVRRNAALSWILAVFGVVSFSWGVMFVPYNFIFLLLMAMPAIVSAHEQPRESS